MVGLAPRAQRRRREHVVQTAAGAIRGRGVPTGLVFQGIPYARPPSGVRRYRAPEQPAPWGGQRDATRFGRDCPQLRAGPFGGMLASFVSSGPTGEDSLSLNVWTPAADDASRPVMVWIHGGAFLVGSGSVPMYDGAAFARDDVVLVTINYRLHALGFLHLDELFAEASGTGNLGILDQIAALEWVRDNIAAFGGDPQNVTIFGESAGAGSVGTLLGTPAADGLYRRAILQSGAASFELPAATATRVAERVLKRAGVPPRSWAALWHVGARRIAMAAAHVWWREARRLLGEDHVLKLAFLPVLDGVTRTRPAIDRIRDGERADIDVLVGTCADEYRAFVWGLPPVLRGMMPAAGIDAYFRGHRTTDDVLGVYADSRPGLSARSVRAAIDGDHMFTIPALRLAEAQHDAGARTYMYRFTWPTPIRGGVLGACHGLDVPFVFDTLDRAGALWGRTPPQDLASAMHGAWVRFATTGDPGGGDLPDWPAYELEDRPVMEFGVRRRVAKDPRRSERLLWEGVW